MCGATSGVARDHDGWACLVCGAPRVPVTSPLQRPRAEKPLLERAKRARLLRAAWGVAASLSLALGGVVLAIGAITAFFFEYGIVAQALFGTLVLTPLFVSGLGFWKSRRAGNDARSALEAAQVVVANEVIAARGGAIDAAELAALLRVSTERAEELVASAQVERMLEGGERFRVEDVPTTADAETADAGAARKGSVQ